MNLNATSPRATPLPGWTKFLLWGLFLVSVGTFIWSQLPKGGFPTDLSLIGAGRATVVLAHDANYAGGTEVMSLLSEIRNDYSSKVDFLVAHMGMAEGQEFARRHAAQDGTIVLFAGDGSPLRTLHQPRDIGELRATLNQAFGF